MVLLRELLKTIIEISKIESNQVSLKTSQFDVNESLNFLYGFFSKGSTFSFSINGSAVADPQPFEASAVQVEN